MALSGTDSEGKSLTREQQAFFKDSKIWDEDGNLLVVYHGTSEKFTVSDRAKGRAKWIFGGHSSVRGRLMRAATARMSARTI